MPGLALRSSDEADLPWLAAMNRALWEDSGVQNGMTPDQVIARFRRRAAEGYRVAVFERSAERVGFASHQARVTDDGLPYTHLAQFLIAREHRGLGLGREAFALLQAGWPAGGRVTLDVFHANAAGRRFWDHLGFRPFSTAMEIAPPSSAP